MTDILDALIIGGGPAGLTAAIYLGRFQRSFLVVDEGESRLGWIPRTRNHPGFPDGVVGKVLLSRMRRQARRYGAVLRKGRVEALEGRDGAYVATLADGDRIAARKVILATGVVDVEPQLPAFERSVKKGLIRICPICDGYEVRGLEVGVIGNSDKGAREALFLRDYTPLLTVIHVGAPRALTAEARRDLDAVGIAVVETPMQAVNLADGRIQALDFGTGGTRRFDTLYSALGSTPQSQLAERLGAGGDGAGCLQVGAHQETAVAGLYTAGDLVRGLNQISVAQAEGAIAATDAHNALRNARG